MSNGEPQEAIRYDLVAHQIQTTRDALSNADSFAQFGLFARLADLRYRLDDDRTAADEGKLQYDANLPPPDPRLNGLPWQRRKRKRAGSSPEVAVSPVRDLRRNEMT